MATPKVNKSNETLVTTWYLDYQGPALNPVTWPTGVQLVEAEIVCPELNQFFFRTVGGPWRWYSRLNWSYQQWRTYLEQQQVRTWLLWNKGTPAGYIELVKHQDNSVEIMFFGLLPQFVGQGLGKKLAQQAVYLANAWQATKVWLHTCSADHPAALHNYQKVGFVITNSQEALEQLPTIDDKQLLTENFVYSSLAFHAKSAG
ncbi:GNAT family N-acetyltransferase [Rheinheimera sp. MMS21-TC3]|uniref:GNAT family N-acetyltransferase n=1 Tax=Rheinheimera sp. MMS21-TC3 TaxID=3072790 RepID=UPI0028C46765|nr:GNAT family N-acetyltransferase [Rheinheimera sp. MMS21-TC3]WNO59977.1 GNAT family N-acetyltransferase [Rheinheimera sp. MMS21-TC3]